MDEDEQMLENLQAQVQAITGLAEAFEQAGIAAGSALSAFAAMAATMGQCSLGEQDARCQQDLQRLATATRLEIAQLEQLSAEQLPQVRRALALAGYRP